MARPDSFDARDGLRYGLLGLPLAFVALPLYVLLPNHYARSFGVPLATLGLLLLGARIADALIDPLLGRAVDRLHARGPSSVLRFGSAAALLLVVAFGLLFFPQVLIDPARQPQTFLLPVAAVLLVLSYAGYSALSIAHQSWGAMLGGDERQRSRVVGWREALGLVGVVTASVLPLLAGLQAMVLAFAVTLGAGMWAWSRAPRPIMPSAIHAADLMRPLQQRSFRSLLLVFVLNGIASAVPATLVLFFVQDRLQAPESLAPAFLGIYFLAAAASIPLWLRVVPRFGLARTWLAGMALAVLVFAWAAALGPGDAWPFLAVCALSGMALGTDLVLPAALLAGVIAQADDTSHAGAYFGWWNFATKLNLALAAGLALPLLGLAGYSPGTRDASALQALSLAYCVLPCVLKLLAGAALWMLLIRRSADLPGNVGNAIDTGIDTGIDTHTDTEADITPEPPDRIELRAPHESLVMTNPRRLIATFTLAAAAVAGTVLLTGCASPSPADYAAERPTLSLRDYFNGRIEAHGMFQNRAGKVVKRFDVTMDCSWSGPNNENGVLDESFVYSDGTTQRRIWKLKALPDGRFTGTADDVVGTAQGEQRGNAFQWRYTLKQPVGDSVYEVQMDDWMYLMNGRVMLNRAVMSKFGIRVGEVTLAFDKR